MLALFACAASLTAAAAGVVILFNMAVDTSDKNRLVRTATASASVGTAPASIAKPVVPSSLALPAIAIPAAASVVVMVDRPEQPTKKKRAAIKQKSKPRVAERRPAYSPWGAQGFYNHW